MIQKPRLKSFLSVFPLSDTRWVFRGGTNEVCRVDLRNEKATRTFHALLPLLDGAQDRDEILAALSADGIERGAVLALLKHLESSHCIEEAGSSETPAHGLEGQEEQIRFFSHFTSEGGTGLQTALADAQVAIVGEGELSRILERQLAEAGVGRISRWSPGTLLGKPDRAIEDPVRLVLVPQDSYDRKLLESMDSYSKRFSVPWLLVRRISILEGWVGPLFIPEETASYLSFEAKIRGSIPFFELHEGMDPYLAAAPPGGASPGLPASLSALCGIAASEAVKFLTGFQVPHLAGRFLTVHLSTWDIESHDVWRVPVLDRTAPPKPLPFPWKDALYGQTGTEKRRA